MEIKELFAILSVLVLIAGTRTIIKDSKRLKALRKSHALSKWTYLKLAGEGLLTLYALSFFVVCGIMPVFNPSPEVVQFGDILWIIGKYLIYAFIIYCGIILVLKVREFRRVPEGRKAKVYIIYAAMWAIYIVCGIGMIYRIECQ